MHINCQSCVHLSKHLNDMIKFGPKEWIAGMGKSCSRGRNILLEHCVNTPEYDIPLWMCGLLLYIHGQHLVRDVHLPWGYGLCEDVEVLCIHRRGPVPFQFMAGLWPKLAERRAVLETEQETTIPSRDPRRDAW